MQSIVKSVLCRILVLAMLSLSFQTAHAGIIGTGQAAVAASVQTDRAVVFEALSRSDVANQMQAQGLDPTVARERVAAMTDEEVHTLASSIATAPAGANNAWGAVILIGLLVWFIWYRK